jgi:ribosomal protein S18 acetylase RimI-like enzyme
MPIEGPRQAPPAKEKAPEIEISLVTPEDYAGAMDVIYQAQLANYPNEELGITKEDIEANFSVQLTEEKIQEGEERWRCLPENPNERYFIAKQNGKVIGRCIVERRDDVNQLNDIYIHPDAQGKGLGKKFWQEALTFFDPTKDTVVMVLPYNEQAKGFYTNLGFVETGRKAHEGEGAKMKSGAIMPVPIEMRRPADKPE